MRMNVVAPSPLDFDHQPQASRSGASLPNRRLAAAADRPFKIAMC
jgi:hypothetical protein